MRSRRHDGRSGSRDPIGVRSAAHRKDTTEGPVDLSLEGPRTRRGHRRCVVPVVRSQGGTSRRPGRAYSLLGWHHIQRLGTPRGHRVRDGNVRRLGRRPKRPRPRQRRHHRDVVRRRPRRDPGAEYEFTIRTPEGDLSKMDPYARHVTNRSATGSSTTRTRSSGATRLPRPTWDDLVIYEMHVGTFAATADRRGTFDAPAAPALPPATGAPPSRSCRRSNSPATSRGAITRRTCSPSSPAMAVRTAFKRFIRDAHAHGIAVIVEWSTTTSGPSDLDLWRFDGWAEGDGGGIYVYNDERAETPWGATRPDYGAARSGRSCATAPWAGWRSSAATACARLDGYIRRSTWRSDDRRAIPDGSSFLAWLNDEIAADSPGRSRSPRTSGDPWSSCPRLTAAPVSARSGMAVHPRIRPALVGRRRRIGTSLAWSGHRRRRPRCTAEPVIYTSPRRGRKRCTRVPEAIAPAMPGLVGQEASGPRLRAGPDIARDPDALPGPGAARGPLVRRRGRLDWRRRSPTRASCDCTGT